MPSNYLYIAVMALVSYTIRILPLTLIDLFTRFCIMCPMPRWL